MENLRIPTLENERIRLSPINLENYKQLLEIAQEDKLVQFSPSKIDTPEDLQSYVQNALDSFQQKTAIPFIIFDKKENAYAGCTRFGHINWHNKVLHIGWTWIGKRFQGTGLNKNMKFLMLEYAFETLQFDKVEFRVDERNITSRKAVEKIGGTLEGILRKDTLMLDGFKRSTCCYGILKEEWPSLKQQILA
ncbi:GCN5 family acetyltransferase [Tamlana nanhaiensis]|uniref:GCN5 family acetyltransferase n=1 Tax=Neotamlana nanhaiensis TaxID=1382798 RepID=A0A0D7W5W9_9FLAO|nr:GNAT family protein [Tamlana nanhaiensis]KJD34531.1 GCN5 family acetyltransferase [Tamlana nanhaiensis]